jgi:hypothetical protein
VSRSALANVQKLIHHHLSSIKGWSFEFAVQCAQVIDGRSFHNKQFGALPPESPGMKTGAIIVLFMFYLGVAVACLIIIKLESGNMIISKGAETIYLSNHKRNVYIANRMM